MADETSGTPGTQETTEPVEVFFKRFIAALDSFKDVVRAELTLIDVDANNKDLTAEERQEFADEEKRVLLKLLRSELLVVMGLAGDSERWNRTKEARAKAFENHAKEIRGKPSERSGSRSRSSLEALDGVLNCPPGFIKVEGICVPV
jgi:hypothetical protein